MFLSKKFENLVSHVTSKKCKVFWMAKKQFCQITDVVLDLKQGKVVLACSFDGVAGYEFDFNLEDIPYDEIGIVTMLNETTDKEWDGLDRDESESID